MMSWTGTSRIVTTVAVGSLLALALSSCKDDEQKNAYAPPPPPPVDIAIPLAKEVTRAITYTGQVVPMATVELRARVQGFLEKQSFEDGQLVKKGALLYQIDPRQYQAAVDKAAAQVEATKAALVGATNDAKLAEDLAEQRAGPKIDAIVKAAKRDAMAAQLDADKASLESAKLDLDFCDIHAPMDGRIGRSLVDVGNLVGRGDPTLLATIVAIDPVYVNVDVSEADVLMVRELVRAAGDRSPDIQPGQVAPGEWRKVTLTIPGHDKIKLIGHINFVDPELNQETGTLRVRSVFENPKEAILPGIFVSLSFPLETYETLLVPDAALLSDQRGRFALIVNDKDVVEQRRVSIGQQRGYLREVTEGLTPTDRVVVLGVLRARPGSKVTPKLVTIEAGTAAR